MCFKLFVLTMSIMSLSNDDDDGGEAWHSDIGRQHERQGQGHTDKRGDVIIENNANEDSANNKHRQHPRYQYYYKSPVISVSLTY